MIGGHMVLDHGRLTTIDEAKLRREACAAAERLSSLNEPMRQFSKRLQDIVGTFCMGLSCQPFHIYREASEDAFTGESRRVFD